MFHRCVAQYTANMCCVCLHMCTDSDIVWHTLAPGVMWVECLLPLFAIRVKITLMRFRCLGQFLI